MQWRQMGTYFFFGSIICVGSVYIFNLKHANKQLSESHATYQAYQVVLLQEKASLEKVNQTYQVRLDNLTKKLNIKAAQYDQLGARIASLDSLRIQDIPYVEGHDGQINQLELDVLIKHSLIQAIPNGSPTKFQRISSLYGERNHPILGVRKLHKGIDLVCRIGDPIISPADGVVETTRSNKRGFGNFLTVRHGYGFTTSYAHLSKFKVRSGEFVRKGDEIATCGNSGNSTGPHLHYEVRFLGQLLDPKNLMDWSAQDLSSPFENEKIVKWTELIRIVAKNIEQQKRFSNDWTDNIITVSDTVPNEEKSRG
ncbi:M23 family metallopeptidase [Vibrio sp. B172a]|uniref:M23 family metallopeptidase n=1 Tax=Vibrio sp. B172a TaxID=2835790 RepID=UPI002555E6C5|nr:M23 family metallopeptidase [Vibrio sp. B172a]MDK9785134.1 M23 family metallopeptidase [Vibrio sp. B172a]